MTVSEKVKNKGDKCLIVKKGSRYLTVGSELGLTTDLRKAEAFESKEQISRLMSIALVDTRNAKLIGDSYDIAPISR